MENLLSKIWKIGLIILVLTLIFGIVIIIIIGVSSVATLGLTWIYAKSTGQSYEMSCHTSDFIWKMNQWGKQSLVIGIILFLLISALSA